MRTRFPTWFNAIVAVTCGLSACTPRPDDGLGHDGGPTTASDASPSADGGTTIRDGATPSDDGGDASTYGGIFTAANVWTNDISADAIDPNSAKITAAIAKASSWVADAGAAKMQIDTSRIVLKADGNTPTVPFRQASGYYAADCDNLSSLPLPAVGAIQGASRYACDSKDGDCHLLIHSAGTHSLYEIFRAVPETDSSQKVTAITGVCAVKWNLSYAYPISLRGDGCVAADSAGFPVSAMIPDADEVASGAVRHALRFSLPVASIRSGYYVHPASHFGGPKGTLADLPPTGVRLRLRANYPVASLPAGAAQVIATALQKYGMFLADGGDVRLAVQGDQLSTKKWSDVAFDKDMLSGILPGDFDVMLMKELKGYYSTWPDCVKNAVP